MAITFLLAQKREPRHWALRLGDDWDLGQYQVKFSPIPPNWSLCPRIKRRTHHPSCVPEKSDPLYHPILVGGPGWLHNSALTPAAQR